MDTNGDPIPNAQVVFFDNFFRNEYQTDENGMFVAEILSGDYTIVVGAWGFNQYSENVSIMASENMEFELSRGYMDDFALDLGWEVETMVSSVGWKREVIPEEENDLTDLFVTPIGDDPSDVGTMAYVTSTFDPDGGLYEDVLIQGSSKLISPAMDLSAYNDPILQFRYFFFNGLISDLTNDFLDVRLMVNDVMEIPLNSFINETEGWSDVVEIKLGDYSNYLSFIKVVFYAEEGGDLNLFNAAIDVFRIVEGSPTSTSSEKIEQQIWGKPKSF